MPTFREDTKIGCMVPMMKTDDINDQAITKDKIRDGNVTTEKLADGAVSTDKLPDGAIKTPKIADENITTSKLAEASVVTSKIADQNVTKEKIADQSVDNSKLSPEAVTYDKLKDKSVITEKLNDRAVTTEKVEEKAITNAKLGDQSVDGRVVREASIESKHIGNNAVSTPKIASRSVTNEKIAYNSVSRAELTPDVRSSIDKKADAEQVNNSLYDLEKKIGERFVVEGDVTNLPDEEDLTSVKESDRDVLKLADRSYAPEKFSGKGYKILRRNIKPVSIAVTKIQIETVPSADGTLSFTFNGKETQVAVSATTDNTTTLLAQKVASAFQESMTEYEVSVDASLITLTKKSDGSVTSSVFSASTTGVVCNVTDSTKREFRNILMPNMINKPNTIYEIRYDYTLAEDITIPTNCILKFNGGSISGAYIITGTNTGVNAGLVKIFNTDIILSGSWCISEAYPEWFGAVGDSITDDTVALSKTLCYFRNIKFNKKTYLISNYIKIYSNTHINGYGEASKIKTADGEYGGFRGYNYDNVKLPFGDCLIENIALIYTKSYVGRVFDCPIPFYFRIGKNMTFKNIYFENAPLVCIGGTSCDNFLIDGCRVHNCADGAFTFVTGKNYKIVNNYVLQDTCLESKSSTSMGAFVDLGASLTNFTIEGNIVIGGSRAIYIRDEVSNGTINGNVFCDQHGNSIQLIFEHAERQYDFVVDNVTISNNVFKQSRNTEDIMNDKAAISCIGCHNMIINGNTFKGTYLYGVYVSGSNIGICISDNMIIDIAKSIYAGANTSSYINISRNAIKNFEVGIYINCVDSYVRNNILYSNISDCIGINVPQYYTRNIVEYNVVNAITPLPHAGNYIMGDCNTLNGTIESNVNSIVKNNTDVALGSHKTQTLYNSSKNTLGLRYKSNNNNYDYDGSPFGVSRYGTTRPDGVKVGFVFFDTRLSPSRPVWYNGSNWVDATGTIV